MIKEWPPSLPAFLYVAVRPFSAPSKTAATAVTVKQEVSLGRNMEKGWERPRWGPEHKEGLGVSAW